MSDDPQDIAEALDADVVDSADDRDGDRYGDSYEEYPPDQPVGVEEDAGDSFEERDQRYRTDDDTDDAPAGQLVDDADGRPDGEEQLLGEWVGGADVDAEVAAVHIEREPFTGREPPPD